MGILDNRFRIVSNYIFIIKIRKNMDNKLFKVMADKKKEQGDLDPTYKDAKMSMLQALLHEMHGMMGQDLHGLKKVEVAAPDKQGLSAGLDKAKELVGHGAEDGLGDASAGDESEDKDGDSDHEEGIADHDDSPLSEGEGSEGGEDSSNPYHEMPPEELQKHLAMLHAKLGKR